MLLLVHPLTHDPFHHAIHLSKCLTAVESHTGMLQMAFVGHDAGHNAISHDRRVDGILGLIVTSSVGIGLSWYDHVSIIWNLPSLLMQANLTAAMMPQRLNLEVHVVLMHCCVAIQLRASVADIVLDGLRGGLKLPSKMDPVKGRLNVCQTFI